MAEESKGALYLTLVAVVAIVGMVAMQGGMGSSSSAPLDDSMMELYDEDGNLLGEARRSVRRSNSRYTARSRLLGGTTQNARNAVTQQQQANVVQQAATQGQQQANIVHQATTTQAQQQANIVHQATTTQNIELPPGRHCNSPMGAYGSHYCDAAGSRYNCTMQNSSFVWQSSGTC